MRRIVYSNSCRKLKKDKAKRAVVYQPFSHVGVNFKCPHSGKITILELSVRQVFLNCKKTRPIPTSYFNKYGRLPFLLKCNYDRDSKHFEKTMAHLYSEMLDYVKNLHSGLYSADVYSSEFILWKKCASKLLKSSADFFRTFSDSS